MTLLNGDNQAGSKLAQMNARIGCAGWSIPREAALWFAPGASHLERYSQLFDACEINSSFYRSHKIETWERWANSVPDGFRFAVKAPRTITHDARLNSDKDSKLLPAFLREVRALKNKLGPILFQLPPSLTYESAPSTRFLATLRELYSGEIVLEPRHPTWFVDEVDCLLEKFHVARVGADPACVPAAGQPGGYVSLVYYRLHGSPRRYYSSYTDNFLELLRQKITNLAANAQVWCVFDNTAAGSAIVNALALREGVGLASASPSGRSCS